MHISDYISPAVIPGVSEESHHFFGCYFAGCSCKEVYSEIENMHELSVTESILKIVLKHAETNDAAKVLSIGLKIGELSELVGDCIQHYFDYLSKGTIAEGAIIEVERSPVIFQCTDCGNKFEVSLKETKDFTCPQCRGAKVTLISGREFYIKDITIS